MHDRDTVELFLLARGEGMPLAEAAELAGVSRGTARGWEAGALPRSCTGRPWGSGRIGGRTRPDQRRTAVGKAGTAAPYDPPGAGPLSGMAPDQIENLPLRAVLDDLKEGGSHPRSMSTRSLCELAARLRRETGLPTSAITRSLEIPRSTYYYWLARGGRDRHAGLRPLVREAFEAVGRRGYRPVWARLRAEGARISEKVVRRIMREEGLEAGGRRRRRYSSYEGEASPAPANLPLRGDGTHDFSAPAPNRLWVTDVTEFRVPAGKCHLSPIIDCFDGMPVAWSIGPRPSAEFADASLAAACAQLAPGERPITHSDRGCRYRWPGWIALCERHGLTRSMSRKGASPDNARAEGFFGLLKNEFFHGRDWTGRALPDFMRALDAWLRRFRSERITAKLGWLAPDGHRESLGLRVPPHAGLVLI